MKTMHLYRYKLDSNQSTGVMVVRNGEGWPIFARPAIERGWKDNKNFVSCVPAGTYEIVFEWSPRFSRKLWELKGVPGRSECKIHSANFWYQLNGCISVGAYLGKLNRDNYYDLGASRSALNRLHSVLEGTHRTTIEIVDPI